MINRTKQNWAVGATVRVGFLSLIVKAAVATPGDYAPDAYILANQEGTQLYKFVPHNGVEKISAIEAQAILAEQEECAARMAFRAMQKAKSDAAATHEIDALFA